MPRARSSASRRYTRRPSARRPRLIGRGAYASNFVPRSYIRGRGGFFGDIWKGVKRFGKGLVTGGIHKAISNVISGQGDYQLPKEIKYNSLFQRGIPEGAQINASMHSTGASIRVCHREYIGNVNTTTSFANTVLQLNPGLQGTFPWLSQIASKFLSYRMHGFAVQFVSTSANAIASTNGSQGIIGLTSNSNAAQAGFANRQQFLNSFGSISSAPSENSMMGLECARHLQANSTDTMYIRTGALGSNDSLQLYDMATLQFCSDGAQSSYQAGELYLLYDVELLNPTTQAQSMSSGCLSSRYNLTSPSDTNKLGTARTLVYDNIGLTLGNNTIDFPSGADGKYLLNYYISASAPGATTAWNNNNLVITGGTTDFIGQAPANTAAAMGRFMLSYVITITDPKIPCNITFNNSPATGLPAPVLAAYVMVVGLGSNYP